MLAVNLLVAAYFVFVFVYLFLIVIQRGQVGSFLWAGWGGATIIYQCRFTCVEWYLYFS